MSAGFIYVNLVESENEDEFNFFVKPDLDSINEFQRLIDSLSERPYGEPFIWVNYSKEGVGDNVVGMAHAVNFVIKDSSKYKRFYTYGVDSDERLRLLIDSINEYCENYDNEDYLYSSFKLIKLSL